MDSQIRETIKAIIKSLFGRTPTEEELDQLYKSYTRTYPTYPYEESNMPSQQIAVFNINPEGALVIRLEDIPQDFKYASHSTVKENAVRTVKERLPADHKVVGVSNPLPSPNGLGGAYVFPVRIIKPIREYDVDIGPSVKSLRGLSL